MRGVSQAEYSVPSQPPHVTVVMIICHQVGGPSFPDRHPGVLFAKVFPLAPGPCSLPISCEYGGWGQAPNAGQEC